MEMNIAYLHLYLITAYLTLGYILKLHHSFYTIFNVCIFLLLRRIISWHLMIGPIFMLKDREKESIRERV